MFAIVNQMGCQSVNAAAVTGNFPPPRAAQQWLWMMAVRRQIAMEKKRRANVPWTTEGIPFGLFRAPAFVDSQIGL